MSQSIDDLDFRLHVLNCYKHYLIKKIMSFQQKYKVSGFRTSNLNISDVLAALDAISRLIALLSKSTCAACFYFRKCEKVEEKMCVNYKLAIGLNHPRDEGQIKTAFCQMTTLNENQIIDFYLSNLRLFKSIESKVSKSIYGYCSWSDFVQLEFSTNNFIYFLEDDQKQQGIFPKNFIESIRCVHAVVSEFILMKKPSSEQFNVIVKKAQQAIQLLGLYKIQLSKILDSDKRITDMLRLISNLDRPVYDAFATFKPLLFMITRLNDDISILESNSVAKKIIHFKREDIITPLHNFTLHAEVKLIYFILQNFSISKRSDSNMIKKYCVGCSKLSCAFCYSFKFVVENEYCLSVDSTGIHKKVYDWEFPVEMNNSKQSLDLYEKIILTIAGWLQCGKLTSWNEKREMASRSSSLLNSLPLKQNLSDQNSMQPGENFDEATAKELLQILLDIEEKVKNEQQLTDEQMLHLINKDLMYDFVGCKKSTIELLE